MEPPNNSSDPFEELNNLDPDSEDYASEYERLRNDPELTQEKLQEVLSKYEKAFEEEFAQKTQANPENIEEYTNDFFRANAHYAAAQVAWLSIHGESESVRLNASKYILESAKKVEEGKLDPVSAIIEGLKKNDNKPQPVNKEE